MTEHLLNEERVSVGFFKDRLNQYRRRRLITESCEERLDLAYGEAPQKEARSLRLAREGFQASSKRTGNLKVDIAIGADHQHRCT